ncbi:hypothetical protein TNIN_464041 [Trichonephila inaurata madagascariensis]|uniref:Uncharacterized protein n=1 Tax=Trichonephila inaurata madagascariensis TaxID=2747483 RepID=A0A8X6J4U4_9ARAC|nr:hypothetical protein TNIN_464041 [Trichonephila inaurata madagascariensis]
MPHLPEALDAKIRKRIEKRLTHYTQRGNEKMMNECTVPDLRHLPFGPVRGPSTAACKSESRLHPRIVGRPLQSKKKRRLQQWKK